ncbi:MAG: hypothetical protein NC905_06555 [Candidatus Omnitrophica bacterium]|nr:hypothetical protein [Candidatus Omnitrophota bacterium]MCM8777899.1 hypothetical protein [Candidatus Omnitrophota bacterium]
MRKLYRGGIFCLFLIVSFSSGEEKKNLVPDGGFEEVRQVIISSDQYFFKIRESGVELTEEGPFVIIPSNFSQFAGGCKKLKVIEGEEGKEVHTGKRAILLSDGSFYLRAESEAETGDVFIARFYAKGKGKVRLILHLTNKEGKYYSQAVPNPFPVDTDNWISVEHRLDTKDKPDLAKIWARLEATGEVYIDDVSLTKE